MRPKDLAAASFTSYPPDAKALATAHVALLRELPLAFVPSLLREIIDFDWKFPTERATLERELTALAGFSPEALRSCFGRFAVLRLTPALEASDWVNAPLEFTEQLSAYLWSTHQMDAFRAAATAYGDRMRSTMVPRNPPIQRLGIAVIGQGVAEHQGVLFRNLREHGTFFSNVDPQDGLQQLLDVVARRAHAAPQNYGHWYVDGGAAAVHGAGVTCVSYAALAPVRDGVLAKIEAEVKKPGMGPEELRTFLTRLSPADLGMPGDEILNRFQVKVLTEGSGTQIFSTTFAQWAGREVLRRTEALTLMVRFAPRQRQRPMHEMLSNSGSELALDPAGSLIDGDMAAYYQWINQQRLPGAKEAGFIVWFEGHRQAMAIGPSLPRGATSSDALHLEDVLRMVVT